MQKRLNKFLAETGRCSRREADALISEGRVTVNGNPAEMGMQVSFEDEIRVDGTLVTERHSKPIYLAFNKPPGIECTTNQDVRNNIIDFINYPTRIFPIGRLDKASEGLIFLTDDGDIVNKILRARNNHEKEYIVTVNKPISNKFISRMGNGIPILDTVTRKCEVEQISEFVFRIVLTQGLNRQIRRMCAYLDYEVEKLQRIRIINIKLDLPSGRYRELTETGISELQTLIEPSSMTEEASLPKPVATRTRQEKTSDFKKPDGSRRNFTKPDNAGKDRPAFDGPKPDATASETGKREFQRRDFSGSDAPKRDYQKPDYQKKDFKKPAGNSRNSGNKDFSKDDTQPREYRKPADAKDQRPDAFKPAPKRFEVIKKDDPRYRGKNDL